MYGVSKRFREAIVAAALALAIVAGRAPAAPAAVSDGQIAQSVQRGLKYIYTARKDAGWDTQFDRRHSGGVEALVLLTALSAGEDVGQPVLTAALQALAKEDPQTTYVRAVRVMVYARLDQAQYAQALQKDVAVLSNLQMPNGGWGYGPDHPTTKLRQDWTDSSNTQMAVLALADAAAAGAPVKPEVWVRAREFWEKSQNADGGWGYEPPGKNIIRLRGTSHGSMTAAGLACYAAIGARLAANGADARAFSPAAAYKGIDWLGKNFSVANMPGWAWSKSEEWVYFYHWKLARAAGAWGLRTCGAHDWYPETAAILLARQRSDGGWAEPALHASAEAKSDVVRTCFALLTLLRGGAPIAMNRLEGADLDQDHPLDAANFAAWMSAGQSQPVGWQRVEMKSVSSALLGEAPVLYIPASAQTDFAALPAPALSDYVLNGGTILVSAAPSADKAKAFFTSLLGKYEMQAVPLDDAHPLWSLHYKVQEKPPGVIAISDSARVRVLIVSSNLAEAWHRNALAKSRGLFELAGNLVHYSAAGLLPGRLAARKPAAPKRPAPKRGVVIARVKHEGGWSACPLALGRLSDVLADALSFGVLEVPAVDLAQDVPDNVSVLWMTGSGEPGLSADKIARLKKFLQRGGTLFADSAIGAKPFADSVDAMLKSAFADAYKELPATHPLLTGSLGGGAGSDVREVNYSPQAEQLLGRNKALKLYGVELDGRVAVVFSKIGVTSGLDGVPIYGAVSLARDDARRLAANVVLYAMLGG
ncbi:MAG: Prenyltransferase and squalene oxidase repeat protein [Planctomycetes bacterium ADurb.Bin126]|nr:MAG: Prenyltransferase and squalene oxidase repeat protein [Planctomycetes bacterium ADurb.Bin126]